MEAWQFNLLRGLMWPWLLALVLLYPVLCSALRCRRIKALQRELGFVDRKSLSRMTHVQAQAVVKVMTQYEFPLVMKKSLQFALFKTYGIPSISKLLVATGVFSKTATASKRYEDTTVLVGEFLAHRPDEERSRQAIGRMNSIHDPYIRAGKISNEDLLYTLSLFISEPIDWINRFEWRRATDLEMCALGTFWKSIGDAMKIQYTGYLTQDSWQDGLDFLKDISQWAQQYERDNMVPAASNRKTGDELVSLLLFYVPGPLKQIAHDVVGVVMGERLRRAMIHKFGTIERFMKLGFLHCVFTTFTVSFFPSASNTFETPSASTEKVTKLMISLRRFVLLHLTLPRLFPTIEFSDMDSKTGRYHHETYLVHPYYVEPTWGNRWGLQAWITWALGGTLPGGKDGSKYYPNGYRFEDVGPLKKKPLSAEEDVKRWEKEVEKTLPLGCPFAISR